MSNDELKELRQAVADYMRSEGCSCCRNVTDHDRHAERLAMLLKVPRYKDGSGYDFEECPLWKLRLPRRRKEGK